MADLNSPDVTIKVSISEDTLQGKFNDSIYYSLAEFEAMKDDDVQAAKQERLNNWLAHVEARKNFVPAEPTLEDLQDMKAEHEKATMELQAKINKL